MTGVPDKQHSCMPLRQNWINAALFNSFFIRASDLTAIYDEESINISYRTVL